ncbi:unnamed protein product [Acanthoscelides obtectus]|uniref:Uncharacterized protein n=1 Tax=Acanthoscelides obtectus TaxID=200917 RepID=A0A9P0Q0I6_ACAOB|nr:unnamed protein product [Acanthoscelides obtectus]CAK1620934.1 hypothetical protein AOBTE_LOCUS659 [Acanthoscelides obtectus]
MADRQTITLSTDVINTLNPRFHSVAIDSVVISTGFKNFNMTNSKLIRMIKNMAPGYLRIDGTLADRIIFSEDGSGTPVAGNFLLTGARNPDRHLVHMCSLLQATQRSPRECPRNKRQGSSARARRYGDG